MKKILSIVLAAVMLTALFASAIAVNATLIEDEGALSIVIDEVTAEAGTEVAVAINLVDNPGISSLKIALSYGDLQYVKTKWSIKPDVCTDPEVDIEDVDNQKSANNSAEGSQVILNWVSGNGICNTDKTFATVTFKVPENAKPGTVYDLVSSINPEDVFVGLNTNVDFYVSDGSVTVPGSAEELKIKNSGYDTLYYDSNKLYEGSVDKKLAALEDKSVLNFTEGAVSTITVRGWVWIEGGEIGQFGYSIDNAAAVYSDSFAEDRADVYGQEGATQATANGFQVVVPVDTLAAGEHSIDVCCKTTDGDEIIVIKDRSTETETIIRQIGVTFEVEEPVTASITNTCFDTAYTVTDGVVTAAGWTGATLPITAFGYTVDGGDPIFDGITLTTLPADDPVKLPANAGENGVRFSARIDCSAYEPGEYKVEIVVKLEDGTVLPIDAAKSAAVVIEDTSLKINTASVTGKAGETVKVEISLKNVTALASLKLKVTWPEELQLTKAAYKCFNDADEKGLTHTAEDWTAVKGEFVFNWLQSDPEYQLTADSVFVTLTFVIPEDAEEGTEYYIDIEADEDDVFAYSADGDIIDVDYTLTDGTVTVVVPKLNNYSFNTVWVDGVQVCDTGDALGFLADNPIVGSYATLGLRGWAWLANCKIDQFGYRIDDGEEVFDAAFQQARADVQAAFGVTAEYADGFNVTPIDISGLKAGEHTVTVLVKADDGSVFEIVEVPFTVLVDLMNVSYDELAYDETQLFSGSVDKKIAALEDVSVLDFEMGDVKVITLRGWVRVSEDITDIIAFAFSIDDGELMTSLENGFIEDRAAELAGAGFPGAQGFKVTVPVEDLDHGEHTIDVYVLTKDGRAIQVVKDRSTAEEIIINPVGVTFTVTKHEGQGDNPGTADAAIIAVAAVSVVALAGAFIGKKALKK